MMFKDWDTEHFWFAAFIALLMCACLAGAWASLIDYNKDIQMAQLGYIQVIQPVNTTQYGQGYEKVWVPRGTMVERK